MGHSPFVDRLYDVFMVGGEWVLYLLVGLSILALAIVIERSIFYFLRTANLEDISLLLVEKLNGHHPEEALAELEGKKGLIIDVAREGLKNFKRGPKVISELMDITILAKEKELGRFLPVLGTTGNNAPFIGLLGTVLGIIKAFHDLAMRSDEGPAVVMAGISEALVATAVGLLVAIPAVVFFNILNTRKQKLLNDMEQVKKLLVAFSEDSLQLAEARETTAKPSPSPKEKA